MENKAVQKINDDMSSRLKWGKKQSTVEKSMSKVSQYSREQRTNS